MSITVTIIRPETITRTQKEENIYSLKALLYYLRDNSTDDYVKTAATIHAEAIERKELRKQERKQRIVESIQDMLLENMEKGDSATILSIQEFADKRQMEYYGCDFVSVKNRIATRPKIEQALKNLAEQGIFQESVEHVVGYRNKVKVWTRIC